MLLEYLCILVKRFGKNNPLIIKTMEHTEFIRVIDSQKELISIQNSALERADKIIDLQNQLIKQLEIKNKRNSIIATALYIVFILVETIDIIRTIS